MVYGDTTRDVRSAMTSNWSIVGQAMAKVSKLEQACKGLSGWLFSSSSLLTEEVNYDWQEVCFSDPLGEKICKFVLEPIGSNLLPGSVSSEKSIQKKVA